MEKFLNISGLLQDAKKGSASSSKKETTESKAFYLLQGALTEQLDDVVIADFSMFRWKVLEGRIPFGFLVIIVIESAALSSLPWTLLMGDFCGELLVVVGVGVDVAAAQNEPINSPRSSRSFRRLGGFGRRSMSTNASSPSPKGR